MSQTRARIFRPLPTSSCVQYPGLTTKDGPLLSEFSRTKSASFALAPVANPTNIAAQQSILISRPFVRFLFSLRCNR